jgi:predicted dienelactone hydrolase
MQKAFEKGGTERLSVIVGRYKRLMRAQIEFRIALAIALAVLLYANAASVAESHYDPLAVSTGFNARTLDLVKRDADRKRDIPLRIYLPSDTAPAPTVLFSHGLGGSREGSAYLGDHWAARGYVVVYVQHPGSDASVWQDKPRAERMAAMKQAANAENFLLRVKDIHVLLDQVERWSADRTSPLRGRLDLKRIGMSGHSFGALTTQAVSGQRFRIGQSMASDARIKAALVQSPSSPRSGDPKQAFGTVRIPWMLMTGTKDIAIIGDADLESRLAVFPALSPGDKYELVLYGAEHSAFTDRPLPGDSEERNPNHHRAILALSTAFWDAYLLNNAAAKEWLKGKGPQSVLEKRDRWQTK